MNLDGTQKDILALTSLVILGAFENVAIHLLSLSSSSVPFYLGTKDKAVGGPQRLRTLPTVGTA